MYVVWGTFVKPSSPMGCLSAAEQALVAQGLQVLKGADGADYLVVGGNNAVTLTIVCVAQQGNTWMVVSASSENPDTATQARDVIRAMIENAPVS
jgi:hypothetical protein